jgi:hypothetical protein
MLVECNPERDRVPVECDIGELHEIIAADRGRYTAVRASR